MSETLITKGAGAWKMFYVDDGIMKPGFYWVNAGDPVTYSFVSDPEESAHAVIKELAALRAESESCRVALLEKEAELEKARERIQKLEEFVGVVADPANGYKRNGSVYIPDVVQARAAALLGAK